MLELPKASPVPCARGIRSPGMTEVLAMQEYASALHPWRCAAPAHPCARGIPYILYIKKPAS